ncbi:MAG: cysteine peptidase family C39 domain-containing protein [Hoylesella buccalis]
MKKRKIIMQRDAMQCGIASLAMICNYFGRFVSVIPKLFLTANSR